MKINDIKRTYVRCSVIIVEYVDIKYYHGLAALYSNGGRYNKDNNLIFMVREKLYQ